MKTSKLRLLIQSFALTALVGATSFANAQIQNPSFELGTGSAASVWFQFGNCYREELVPRTGSFTMKMFGNFTGGTNVTGTFQDFAISPGQTAAASVYAQTASFDAMSGDNFALLKLIYRDINNNDLVSSESIRIDRNTPVDQYQLLAASLGPAPANTHHGSVFLLFLQLESTPFAGGSTFFDDVSVSVGGANAISGTVTLGDWGASPASQPLTVVLRQGGVDVETISNVAMDANGGFNCTTSRSGLHDVVVKAPHWLAKQYGTTVNLTSSGVSGLSFSLTNGDCDGDNEVGIGDYSVLSAAYGSDPGSGNWNPVADLNGDDAVDIADYAILSSNYGLGGD